MANQRAKRLMQESLDEALPQDSRQELFTQLDQDPQGAAEYQRLRQVDRMLKVAPYERAPKSLAMHILARLAEGLHQPQLSQLSGLALALALALVALILVPVLVGAAGLFLGAVGSAGALTALMQMLATVVAVVVAALTLLVDGAKAIVATYPQTPSLMFSLVPVGLWIARSSRAQRAAGRGLSS